MKDSIWHNCYDEGWQNNIVSEAFSHPVKFSRGLIYRIYKHALEMGWIKAGDWILDPFGGVALGGLDAMALGLNWIGVEIEEKFIRLGQQNIELWRRQLKGLANLGTARIVQGDSRNLKDLIESVDLMVSSPPFQSLLAKENPKFTKGRERGKYSNKSVENDYGSNPSNLANLPEGKFEVIVESPPHGETTSNGSRHGDSGIVGRDKKAGKKVSNFRYSDGQSPGQLGSMKEGSFDGIISSPPYENSMTSVSNPERDVKRLHEKLLKGKLSGRESIRIAKKSKHNPFTNVAFDQCYSKQKDNLGNQSGDTFWSASKIIVQQCYDLLKSQGHAIWVVKDYVKAKKRVPFSDRWLALCESVGFKLVCRHYAILKKSYGKQKTIYGKEEEIFVERKSFFRRLAESKGSPRIDWEDVICMEKIK